MRQPSTNGILSALQDNWKLRKTLTLVFWVALRKPVVNCKYVPEVDKRLIGTENFGRDSPVMCMALHLLGRHRLENLAGDFSGECKVSGVVNGPLCRP